MQLTEKKFIVVASLVVHYCTIMKDIVASQLYDVDDVQFTLTVD